VLSWLGLSTKWQAAQWSFSTSMRGGTSEVHRKCAYGQRVWKLQPGGGATGLRVWHRHSCYEGSGIRVQGVCHYCLCVTQFNDPPEIHDCNSIANVTR